MGSAPGEVAPAVSKVRHRACGNTRLDLEVKESTTYEYTNITDTKKTNTKSKMARDAQDRARTHDSEEDDVQSPQIQENRRETLLPQTAQKLRIWELEDLSTIENWTTKQKEAALNIQKQIMQDYVKLADTYNALVIQNEEHEAKIHELQDGIEQLQEVIHDDKKMHEKQANVIEYLQNQAREGTPTSTTSIKTKSTKLPDPPILTDGKEPTYDDWIAKMQSKLEANQDHFPTQALKIGYVQSRVASTAALHINPRLRPTTTNKFQTVDEIFEVLDKVYSDPDRKYTARQAYRKLYQNKDTFSSFWAEFQRLTVELDIDEETLIDDLRHKVNTKMQNALITEINPTSLHGLARKCLLIDQNLQKLQAQESRIPARKPYVPALAVP